MGEIVNLKRVKKAKARADAESRAAESRVRHGLTKAAKQQLRRERELEQKRAASRKLDRGEDKA